MLVRNFELNALSGQQEFPQRPLYVLVIVQNPTPRQNVYACARLSISGLFFSHTFQSDQSGSVVLLHAARVFDYFVVIEIAFMDNQAQITETISRLDSEEVRIITQCVILARVWRTFADKNN